MQRVLKGAPAAKMIRQRAEDGVRTLASRGVTPQLAILRMGENADDIAYEQSLVKRCGVAGVGVRCVALSSAGGTLAALEAVAALNDDALVHGVLVMRPLPPGVDERAVAKALRVEKDVDGMTPGSLASVFIDQGDGFAPCTAQAVIELLRQEGIELAGKEAVVIGRSLVVGRPLGMLLLHENATVTLCHTRTKALADVCRRADILIAAAGQRHMVDERFVKPGAILVDVGIHVDDGGALAGDIRPDAYACAGAYTPVPGGVGGVTGWLMVQNVVAAALRSVGAGR